MKRFLLIAGFIFAWTIGLFVLNEKFNAVLCSRANTGDERRLKADKVHHLLRELPPDEIPIVGSSRAGNYVGKLISDKARIYSFSGSRLKETLFLVKKALQTRPSGLIIVNIDPWGAMGYDDQFTAVYDLVADDPDVKTTVPNLESGTGFFAKSFPYAFRFKRNLQTFIQVRKKQKPVSRLMADAPTSGGALTDAEWAKMNATVKPWYFEIRDEVAKQLAEIHAAQGIAQIVWVVVPIAPYKRKLHQNPEAVREFLNQATTHPENYGFDFFTDSSDFTQDDFVDPNHLNPQGCKKFSQRLGESLLKIRISRDLPRD